MNWTAVPGAAAYDIRGRKLGETWVSLLVGGFNNSKTVFGLQSSTNYEWAVRAWCDTAGIRKSLFTVLDTFATSSMNRSSIRTTELNLDYTQLSVSPNPSNGLFNVFLSSGNNSIKGQLKILNIFGEEVDSIKVRSSSYKVIPVDMSDHSSGIYLVLFKTNRELKSQTIVLK